MISSKKYVDETLRKYNISANKALGQNFLVEKEIAEYIVDSANINENSVVIEIGPGLGALTEYLVLKANRVIAFEIDKQMVNILNDTFKCDNLEIICKDFSRVDLKELLESYCDKEICIISNLPYYITSKLLNKILVNDYKIKVMIAMMQKEVGLKLIKPENKEINPLTIILDYQYKTSIVKYVSKNSYLPRPNIDSIVLKFEKIVPEHKVNFKTLYTVCEAMFQARRKTISNNLKELISNEKLLELGIDPCTRGENLSMDDILKICDYLG